jgi:dihydroorotate dehydrogenase (NAD+) catalytic subunit
LQTVVIANLSGNDTESYVEGAKLLNHSDVDMIELNISCPNVTSGGMAFGLDPCVAAELVHAVRTVLSHKPLVVKLSPNAPDINAVAHSCVSQGADALSLVNTFKAMAIDIHARKPVFENTSAGLSGPAIRPIALRMVWELCETVRVPVIGMGGIATATDALEFLLAGAAAVQVGSATFVHPPAMNEIACGIEAYLCAKGFRKLAELCIRA